MASRHLECGVVTKDRAMAKLTVRKRDAALVRALKRRAALAGVSAEELHRRILRRALIGPRRTGADLTAALRRLGALGLELDPDQSWEPPRVDFDATPSPPPSDY